MDKEKSFVPQAKMLKVLQLVQILLHGGGSILEIHNALDCSDRTVYRYIKLLEELDFCIDIKLDGSNRYFIASDSCPVCNNFLRNPQNKN